MKEETEKTEKEKDKFASFLNEFEIHFRKERKELIMLNAELRRKSDQASLITTAERKRKLPASFSYSA